MNIYDIAKLANVSIATVSRVVNNSPKVSPKTKEKVLAVMKENEYTPNAFARGLGLGSMKTVGIICPNIDDIYMAKYLIWSKIFMLMDMTVFLAAADLNRKKRRIMSDFFCLRK